VTAPILGLLAILFASYWQTIRAYPNNGGAYIVSKEKPWTKASLLAAAAADDFPCSSRKSSSNTGLYTCCIRTAPGTPVAVAQPWLSADRHQRALVSRRH
jgi:hypothetical protein